MIPKIIHYIWFGRSKLSDLNEKCISSWKKMCPDYQIMVWNEDTFDIESSCTYVREAYENKKWAFVSDYVRLFVLRKYGGIYLDTDVELLKSLNEFLSKRAFFGFDETGINIGTGTIGCEQNCQLFSEILKEYEKRSFVIDNGKLDLTPNVFAVTKALENKGLVLNGLYQELDCVTVFPKDFFSPKSALDGSLKITKNTTAIHYYSGSWGSKRDQKRARRRETLCRKFGTKIGLFLERSLELPVNFLLKVKEIGFFRAVRAAFKKAKKNKT